MAVDTRDERAPERDAGPRPVAPAHPVTGADRTATVVATSATVPVLPQVVPELGIVADASVLDDPHLVLTDGYIGRERRRAGTRALLVRAAWNGRRRLLRLDLLIVLAVATMVGGAFLLAAGGPSVHASATAPAVRASATAPAVASATTPDGPLRARPHTPNTPPPAPTATAPAASSTLSASDGTVPGTPDAMGAAALALVRYPWRQLPGYSIVFLPISQAPSPGFYGNTSFTWGQPGGVSTLYVYPGETVDRLAAITAFEIGHEVDAAYVEARGGHDAIESILGIHPASWAPQCDCAEQGYLSGWYAAAFSDYWSPGVGAWSSIAPVPSGTTLTAMEPWLDPTLP